MHVQVSAAIALMLMSVAPAAAPAQGDQSAADTREVLAYRLTLPKLQQLNEALADLQRQRDADPAYQQVLKKKQELAALAKKEDPSDVEQERMAQLEEEIAKAEEAEEDAPEGAENTSLSDMANRMAADPRISGALRRAGVAPREAAVMELALFQAAFAAEALANGTIKAIPKEVSAENVKFYQAHKAEIAALKALGEREERP